MTHNIYIKKKKKQNVVFKYIRSKIYNNLFFLFDIFFQDLYLLSYFFPNDSFSIITHYKSSTFNVLIRVIALGGGVVSRDLLLY